MWSLLSLQPPGRDRNPDKAGRGEAGVQGQGRRYMQSFGSKMREGCFEEETECTRGPRDKMWSFVGWYA